MGFGFIIVMRVLFVACMVFIIGHVFGGFSKKPALVNLTKVAAILIIVLFIATNAFFSRVAFGHFRGESRWHGCDSTHTEQRHIP